MRHIPTSLYIDTEVFKGEGLRFDTKPLTALTSTFVKGGLRLLVPKIMERELVRHLERHAEKITDALCKAHESDYIKNLGLSELPPKEELKAKCIKEMDHQWSLFKEHFVVESLPIVGNLEEVIDWYFEVTPPFLPGKKAKEFPDAFILSVLDQYHRQHHASIAVISKDGDFKKACITRRYISYFTDVTEYTEAFKPELTGKERLQGDVDVTKPITTEDLTVLKEILARGSNVISTEIERVLQLLESRGSNYDYFFRNADDPVWLEFLSKKGYFLNPPDIEPAGEGHYVIPRWPPLEYLLRIFDSASADVIDIISKLPDTNNSHVLEGILEIVLKADSADVVLRFSRFIKSFIENYRWGHELIISLLKKPYILDSKLSEVTPTLLLKLVEFRKDPREEEKYTHDMLLEPLPRFDQWAYREILEKGIRSLAESEPYKVARILIDAVASMIRLGMSPEDFEKKGDQDFSEIWCRKLNESDPDYRTVKEILVQTLTYTCEQVYNKASESIDALDQALRNHRWMVFKRLRQHLYASYPNDQILLWIREQILNHDDYPNREHHYEFQLMIRKATEHFGSRLLSMDERKNIFDAILAGPSNKDFREWMGEQYSSENFHQAQRHFHYVQLRPFTTLLTGDIRDYFEELEAEAQNEAVTDDSYAPIGKVTSGFVTYRSPKSTEDLESLTDKEILTYINDWNEEHRDTDDRLIEINIPALADVFQSLFKDQIVPDSKRLNFWITNCDKIARPVYITAMLKAILELVKDQDFEKLSQWVELCAWVLSNQETARVEGKPEPRDTSCKYPDWSSSRRAVVDFLDACVSKDTDASIAVREGLASLLQQACNQFDWRLDNNRPVLLSQNDPITEAINNTRSRALESLVHFAFWVRRHLPEDDLQELTDILDGRISVDATVPLTLPEHALLGMHFGNLCTLKPNWARKHKEIFFPKAEQSVWRELFGSYIRFNGPKKLTFDILKTEFEYAVENLNILVEEKDSDKDIIDRLGQHLFSYYLWGIYPLKGDESLLEDFYDKTSKDKKHWIHLFDHVGRSLKNSGTTLNETLTDRIIDFFNWRLEMAVVAELQQFTFWLEAECLAPEWRLQSYSKILDIQCTGDDLVVPRENFSVFAQVKALNDFLDNHIKLVVECFAKITDTLKQDAQGYIPATEGKAILKAGLHAGDDQIREDAERAKENLLQLGHFDFLDIE